MKLPNLDIPDKIFGIDSANVVIFVPLVVVIILAVSSIGVVFMPRYDEIVALQGSLTSIRSQSQTIIDKTRYVQSIDPAELQKNSESLTNAVLPQKNAYVLVDVVRKVVAKYGFQVDSFLINPGQVDGKTTKPTLTNGVSPIPLKVEISGPKSAYLPLIKAVERSLPILSITSFKMTSVGEMSKLDMEITAFYLDDSSKFDINKLSLSDLTLTKDENDLVTNLGQYTIVETGLSDAAAPTPSFVKYDRQDPFSP